MSSHSQGFDNKKRYTASIKTVIGGFYFILIVLAVSVLNWLISTGINGHEFTLLSIALAVLAISAGFILADWVSAPIRTLTDCARRMARGDNAVAAPVSKVFELALLAKTFNEMFAIINDQQRELLDKYVKLETKNIELERAVKENADKTELLEKQKKELIARSEAITRKNEEIRLQNHRLALLNLELSDSNKRLQDLVEELQQKDEMLGRIMQSEAAQASAIIDGTADPIIVTDQNGFIDLINPAAVSFFNIPAGTAVMSCCDVLRCMDSAGKILCGVKAGCPLRCALENRQDHYQEVLVYSGDRKADVGLNWSLVKDPVSGLPEKAVCILRDMTRQKEVDRAKSDFVSAVSHELKTPLTSMKGFTYLLLRDDIELAPEEVRDYLAIIDDQIERFSRMIEDLLNVSRIEAGIPIETRCRMISLDNIITRVINDVLKVPSPDMVNVSVPSGLRVYADEDKLIQIFTNLLANAVKFSPPGSSVDLTVVCKDGYIVTKVADKGVGIPPESLNRIFDRFYRSDNVRGKIGGTGIGLFITRALVEAHGGSIWAESGGLGKGASLCFTLPRRDFAEGKERRAG